jgi:16S rRNA processing protein RimM
MDWAAMAVVGRIARAHGIRGHLVVNLETDFPDDRFRAGAEVFIERAGRVDAMRLTSVRFANGRPIVGLAGIDTRNEAEALSGRELRVPVGQLRALPSGTFYRHDLIGCRVETRAGAVVGVVRDVEGTVAGSRLVLEAPTGEIQIPLASEICTEIDTGAKRIVVEPPEGLLDLNVRDSN